MKIFSEKIRSPQKGVSLKIQIITTIGITLSGYYLYCNYVLGFLPETYMMMWIAISCLSFFAAYICWYAKGEEIPLILISGGIIGVLFVQAFSLTQRFYVYHPIAVIVWSLGVMILHRKPKEFPAELALTVVTAFFYQQVISHWG